MSMDTSQLALTKGISITDKLQSCNSSSNSWPNYLVPKDSKINQIFTKNYADDTEKALTWNKIIQKAKDKGKFYEILDDFSSYFKKLHKDYKKHKEWQRGLSPDQRKERRGKGDQRFLDNSQKKLELLKMNSQKTTLDKPLFWQKRRQ